MSHYDHLNKTGNLPNEKQTWIDFLVARDLTEAGAMKVPLLPTAHMLAAKLTNITGITVVFLVLLDADKRKTEGEHIQEGPVPRTVPAAL
jgi:hypothetical protein